MEGIKNKKLNIRVIPHGVDYAAKKAHTPQPISKRSSRPGAEAEYKNNLHGMIKHDLLSVLPLQDSGNSLSYQLMISPDGAVELSCFIIEHGEFTDYRVRLFISDGNDINTVNRLSVPEAEEALPDFKPIVEKK